MLELDALKFSVQGKDFYLGIAKAGDLIRTCQVDVWTPDQKPGEKGYQRACKPRRSKRFATFLSEFKGTFHQTVLINIRDKNLLHFDPISGSYGKLRIETSPWVVDGQHRLKGLEILLSQPEKRGEFENFPVPVLISSGLDRSEEALTFFIANKTQEGVKTEHSDRILVEAVGEKLTEELLQKVVGMRERTSLIQMTLDITDELNQNNSSIWKGRIALPTERLGGDRIIRQRSFTDSLKPLLQNDITKSFFDNLPDDIIDPLIDYWNVIAELCPKACGRDSAQNYVLLKTTGVFVMHRLFPYVILECKRPLTKEKMKNVLQKIEEMNDDDWESDGELGRMGTSQKAFSDIFSRFLKQIQE